MTAPNGTLSKMLPATLSRRFVASLALKYCVPRAVGTPSRTRSSAALSSSAAGVDFFSVVYFCLLRFKYCRLSHCVQRDNHGEQTRLLPILYPLKFSELQMCLEHQSGCIHLFPCRGENQLTFYLNTWDSDLRSGSFTK